MPKKAHTPICGGNQDTNAAFAEYAAVVANHACDPDNFDLPERQEQRARLFERFVSLFEGGAR